MAAGSGGARRCGPQSGVVFAEFLIAFPVVFTMFLAVVQLSLLAAASLIVQHAAYRGARQISVVLDDDPAQYDGAPRMQLLRKGSASQAVIERAFSRFTGGEAQSSDEGPRMQTVTRAVRMPLAALAPPYAVVRDWLSGSTPALDEGALDGGWTMFASALAYTPLATTLEFEGKGKARELRFQPGERVKLRVEYIYACSVPIVNQLVCGSIVPALDGPLLQKLTGSWLRLPRVFTFEGRATAAIHHAAYRYRSEHQ